MNPEVVTLVIIGYFLGLVLVARLAGYWSRKWGQGNDFSGFKSGVPWFVVAFGMVGTSLSGVTFVSVPGDVGAMTLDYPQQPKGMTYFQVVIGYLLGYIFIAFFLLPFYYRSENRSIYSNLAARLGSKSPKVAAFFFVVARLFGSSARLYLTLSLLYTLFYSKSFVSFELLTIVSIFFIYLYSSRSGLNSIVWTDTVQTIIFIAVLIYLLFYLGNSVGWESLKQSPFTQVIEWDLNRSNFVGKSVAAGFVICVAMTGLDQDMIQKSLMCRSLRQAQINMLVFSVLLLVTSLLFLLLGAMMYEYAISHKLELPAATDLVLPELMVNYLDGFSPILLLLGLVSSSASSVDGTIAAVSTTFFENFYNQKRPSPALSRKAYFVIAFLIVMIIISLYYFLKSNTQFNVITLILSSAAYLYAPILALFAAYFVFSKKRIKINSFSFVLLILSSILGHLITEYVNRNFDYKIGFESILLCTALAFLILIIHSYLLPNDQK